MNQANIRIWRTPYSEFHTPLAALNSRDCETLRAEHAYTDDELAKIAEYGFNGFWVHGLLHNLVKSPLFPEFGEFEDEQIAALRRLIARAARYGVKPWLLMQPPRAVRRAETAFWEAHKTVAGTVRVINWDDLKVPTDFISLCTSHPLVEQYLHDAAKRLSELLPGLGGAILITASEYPAHCCGYPAANLKAPCPRCWERGPAAVIAGVLNQVASGFRDAGNGARVIAMNWAWSSVTAETDVIEKLDRDIIVLSEYDRGGSFPILGHAGHQTNEYALSYPGPAEQFLANVEKARRFGVGVGVKFQLETTHENGAIPNLAVIPNLFRRAQWLKHNPCDAVVGCWNFGNMHTANSAAFSYFASPEAPDDEAVALPEFARRYFPGADAEKVAAAWQAFADAMKFYPHTMRFVYYAPTSYTLGHFIPPGKLGAPGGPTWLKPDAPRGDDLNAAFQDGEFTVAESLSGMREVARRWLAGCELLEAGLHDAPGEHAHEELASAIVAGCAFHSAANAIAIYRKKLETGDCSGEFYRAILRDELAITEKALPYVESDARIGFHSEAQSYNFSAVLMREKIQKIQAELSK